MKSHPTNTLPSDVFNICPICAEKHKIHTVYRIFAVCEVCGNKRSVMQFVTNPSYMGYNIDAMIVQAALKF